MLSFLFLAEGRATRADYWLRFWPLAMTYAIVCQWVDYALKTHTLSFWTNFVITLIFFPLSILIRRCHDRGYSGWFLSLYYGPLLWALLVFTLLPLGENGHPGLVMAIAFGPLPLVAWPIVDLGFFRGDAFGNKYGPRPARG